MDRRQRPSRAGFTLVEVLIAILIVATLVALLLPAVQGAFRRAREAAVTAEINNLATALADFKQKFGEYPPSRILLNEQGYGALPAAFLSATVGDGTSSGAPYNETPLADSNCTDMTNQQLAQRSLAYLSRFWPRVDFNGGHFDFNGDGTIETTPYILSGSECLTFFLGGVPTPSGSGSYAMTGFSKNPLNPFDASPNRTIPNYEFNTGRLIDQDGDHVPSYIDPINTTPGLRRGYAYFYSYGSNAYDPNDVNGFGHQNGYEMDDNGKNVELGFRLSFPTTPGGPNPPIVYSPSPNPYTAGPSANGNVSWINPNSFQILCAGSDGLWGLGGTYVQNGANGTLPIPGGTANINGETNRSSERDNLTNFATGRLD